ncbi:MAG: B12-binding domain-containing radical SAM protein [Candidatus Omnitrophica bacterium]|nr:B12-binding domain-containing radical SAM protein [Candidatus Omnitrophota bacterium]
MINIGKSKEVILVNVTRKCVAVQLPIWLAVLANALKKNGIEPRVIDLVPVDPEKRDDHFRAGLSGSGSIVGFSVLAGNDHINQVEHFARLAKAIDPGNVIVYGGALPTSDPELILNNCVCDYIVCGEGEARFPELINYINGGSEKAGMPLDCYARNKNGVVGERGYRILAGKKSGGLYKLSDLSQPDYSVLHMEFYINYLRETGQSFEIMASRGCKGNCSFCSKIVKGLGLRDVDSVLDEISYVRTRYDYNKYYFVDENFLDIKSNFKDFVRRKTERKMDFSYIGQCRVDAIDPDICGWGRDSGLRVISIGIESVNQQTLNKVNKNIDVNIMEEKIGLLRKYGIDVAVNFIIGFPEDTENDLKEMISFIRRNGLENKGKVSYLTPLPGTRLWRDCINAGVVKDQWKFVSSLGNLFYEKEINLTNLPDDVLEYYFCVMNDLLKKPIGVPVSPQYLNILKG